MRKRFGVFISLTPDFYDWLCELAKFRGTNLANYCRNALYRQMVADQEQINARMLERRQLMQWHLEAEAEYFRAEAEKNHDPNDDELPPDRLVRH